VDAVQASFSFFSGELIEPCLNDACELLDNFGDFLPFCHFSILKENWFRV